MASQEYVRAPFVGNNLLDPGQHAGREGALLVRHYSDKLPRNGVYLGSQSLAGFSEIIRADCYWVSADLAELWVINIPQELGPIGVLSASSRVMQSITSRRGSPPLGTEVDEVSDVVAEIKKWEPHGLDCAIDAAGFRYVP